MWAYVYYSIYLDQIDVTNHNAIEKYVYEKVTIHADLPIATTYIIIPLLVRTYVHVCTLIHEIMRPFCA